MTNLLYSPCTRNPPLLTLFSHLRSCTPSYIIPQADLTHLVALHCSGCGIRTTSAIIDLTLLQDLDLSNNNIVDINELLAVLSNFAELKILDLSENPVTNFSTYQVGF